MVLKARSRIFYGHSLFVVFHLVLISRTIQRFDQYEAGWSVFLHFDDKSVTDTSQASHRKWFWMWRKAVDRNGYE